MLLVDDPVRPWVDADGLWYVALSLDACDNTQPICAAGGSLLISTSRRTPAPALDVLRRATEDAGDRAFLYAWSADATLSLIVARPRPRPRTQLPAFGGGSKGMKAHLPAPSSR